MSSKQKLYRIVVSVAVAFGMAGCAHFGVRSGRNHTVTAFVKAQARHYDVSPQLMLLALNMGYQPKIQGKKTVFCRSQTPTGSFIAHDYCVSANNIRSEMSNRHRLGSQMQRFAPGSVPGEASGP